MADGHKTCRGCGCSFAPSHHNQAYHSKACHAATAPERRRAYRAAGGRAVEAAWLKTYRARSDVKQRRVAEARDRRLAWYGFTSSTYGEMLSAQGGCAGCGIQTNPKGRRLDIDHEHVEDEKQRSVEDRHLRVRGLLCIRCNRALGLMQDNAEYLQRLAAYVGRYEQRRDA